MLIGALLLAHLMSSNLFKEVQESRVRATVEKLASWPNRNTSNATHVDAANWLADEYRKIPGLQVEIFKYPINKGPRIREDGEAVEVIATLPGETERRVIIGGHFDTINMSERTPESTWTLNSPGANDDASGTSVALEAARVLSGHNYKQTLVFVAFSGEEQGLLGSAALAERAKKENWQIDAVLSNDMVGSSSNLQGERDPHHLRLFSDEVARGARNADGELVPHHDSRELARFIEWISRDKIKGFNVKLVFRADRFGRGGDHTPFNRQGFNAIRFVEPHEEYTRQHSLEDLPKYIDWPYLANSARINTLVMETLANAGDPPTDVRVDRAQGYDTHLTWKGNGDFVVYWRETTSPIWQASKAVGNVTSVVIPKVSKDDYIFAVGAANGLPVEAR